MSNESVFDQLPKLARIGEIVIVNVRVDQRDEHGKMMMPRGIYMATCVVHFDWEFQQITHWPAHSLLDITTAYEPKKKN